MRSRADFKHVAASLLARLPTWPPSFVMAQVVNQALKPLLMDGSLNALEGKRVAIVVDDLGLRFNFSLRQSHFVPVSESGKPDLLMQATLPDFYLLATRQEDQDTLFFNRRLIIEGDTELGLVVKNSMDSMEVPKPLLTLQYALQRFDGLRNRLRRT